MAQSTSLHAIFIKATIYAFEDYGPPEPVFCPWWRHQMETFSALLALCAGTSPVTGELPSRRPVRRSFHAFFDLRLNKRLGKQSTHRWFETPSRSLWSHFNASWKSDSRIIQNRYCKRVCKINQMHKHVSVKSDVLRYRICHRTRSEYHRVLPYRCKSPKGRVEDLHYFSSNMQFDGFVFCRRIINSWLFQWYNHPYSSWLLLWYWENHGSYRRIDCLPSRLFKWIYIYIVYLHFFRILTYAILYVLMHYIIFRL